MRLSRSRDRTLNDYVWLSWAAPALLATLTSLTVFFLLAWLDCRNEMDRIIIDLEQKSVIAARRLSAEILLAENGSVEPVAELLTQELNVSSIMVASTSFPCGADASNTCHKLAGGNIEYFRKIPHAETSSYVILARPANPLGSFLNLGLLVWSALPVLLAFIAGLLIQRYFLRRFVIEPISSLITAAERQTPVPDHWPLEMKQIANGLAQSFEAREQAVFAMLARGVVHDIKTFLHSLLTATELVQEQELNPEKRTPRLESLYRACASNLPKMKRIIELTLDGSREIPIRTQAADILETIHGAIDANSDLARARGVQVLATKEYSGFEIPHDPVQMERAFTNLIKNGIEAVALSSRSSSKGVVRIGINDKECNQILVTVEDSGAGFAVDKDTTFTFRPVKSSKAHGAGLGLYITEKIVRGHGGFIVTSQSSELGGASFTVCLPTDPRCEGVTP